MVNAILIGPAGTGGSNLENFSKIKQLGLDAVEIEFTYGVWMKKSQAKEICALNKKLGLKLSIHAPYFINLNSEDEKKIVASRKRILDCCEIGDILKAKYIVFHPGFYLKSTKEQAYSKIKQEIIKIQSEIKERGYNIRMAPETTGKPSQFGDLDEILSLMRDTGCSLTLDFAHLKARSNGNINYEEILSKIKNLKEIHCHFSGIEFTEKGERRHKLTEEKDIKELFHYLKKYKINAIIINESPNPLGDAIKMKKILKNG
jgi:deoxyribonuclease-4